ncbi:MULTISPECIES: guanylate kinase [Actinotignum]|uniref:guanylate kinase n=1 Tax=Actinotignum TaxID=1653174 RepID=UPI000B35F677|nr:MULTISPECIES: guanylate kinase [Actinotignum]MDE1536498.1 guanylate kinase [Actinotignum schaalii]MDK7270759.1 guanylate kinase [Actinotignum schaalii]MDY5145151.1 guanylate kinase [Actinotignum timonense]
MTPEDHRRICVLAGPSGVGKGTVVAQLLEREPRIWLSISATTRAPRPGEREGESYFFVDDEHFDHLVESGEMLEWAVVHGKHRYGTPRQPVLEAYAAGKIPLLEIDLAGARQVRQSLPEAFQIFLAPPSFQELEARLRGRGTETEEAIDRRLETARGELAAQEEFDAVVVNDTVARATGEILDLIAPKR